MNGWWYNNESDCGEWLIHIVPNIIIVAIESGLRIYGVIGLYVGAKNKNWNKT